MEDRFALELRIPPVWERIDAVRELVAKLVGIYGDEDFRDALSMVCAELLENAVKYGHSDSDVELTIRSHDGRVLVTCVNAVLPSSVHPRALRDRVDWLRSFSDPFEAYTRALERVYEQADRRDGDSGLGIVRIAYDGGCDVECDISESHRVVVRARSRRSLGSDG